MLLLSSLLLAGCAGTITPVHTAPQVASFDGSEVNSGIISFTNGAAGRAAWVTPHLADRYAALMAAYGLAWFPPVQPGDGLTLLPDGTCLLDKQHLAYFLIANQWRKEGKPAVTNFNQP